MKLVLISLLTIGLGSCGKPNARSKDGRKIKNPENSRAGSTFYLSEEKMDKAYVGALLAWTQDPDSQGMADVNTLSQDMTDAGVRILEFTRDEILPFKGRLEPLVNSLIAKKAEARRAAFVGRVKAAATWVVGADGKSGELKKLVVQLVKSGFQPLAKDKEIKHFETRLALYCEAKLIERAISQSTINNLYTRRPMPLAMCEGVYRKLNLVNTESELCRGAEQGKSYFPCFWREGVLKTKLFKIHFGLARPKSGAILARADLTRLQEFFGAEGRNDLAFLRQKLKDLEIPGVGVLDVSLSPEAAQKQPLAGLSMLQLIKAIETGRKMKNDLLRLVPHGNRSDKEKEIITSFNVNLRKRLKVFASAANGINEVTFNEPFLKKGSKVEVAKAKLASAQKYFPQVFAINEAAKKLIAEAQATGAKIKPIVGELKEKQLEVKVDPEICKSRDTLRCALNKLENQMFSVLSPENVTSASVPFQIQVKKPNAKTLIFATQFLPKGKVFSRCLSLGEGSTCKPEDSSDELSAETDEETGQISLKLKLPAEMGEKERQKFGLGKMSRSDYAAGKTAGFNALTDDDIANATIEVSGRLSEVKGVLTLFIGSLKMTRDGETLRHGSVKLKDAAPPVKVEAATIGKMLSVLQ